MNKMRSGKINPHYFGRRVARAMAPVQSEDDDFVVPAARRPKLRMDSHRRMVGGMATGRWGHCGCASCNGRSWKRSRKTQYREKA